MSPWDVWKKGFDAWEASTARFLEQVMKSAVVLEPAGAALSTAMKAKAKSDEMVAQWWAAMGLATRRDQERTLHALNQLQSRLIDLEEQVRED